jgi:hypothetical protein
LQQREFNPKKFLGQPAAKPKLKGVRVVWIGWPVPWFAVFTARGVQSQKILGQPAAKAKLKGVRVVWIGRPKGNPFKFFLHGFGSGPLAFEAGRAKGKTDFRFFLSTF